jgi:hypothetical protein
MFVTGYDHLDVRVTNPLGFVISRTLQTVAGSAYYRLLVDEDDFLDVRTYDYNLQEGEYTLRATPVPGSEGGQVYDMCIGIDGHQNRLIASNYSLSEVTYSAATAAPDTFTFYFEVEETSSIQPPNGLATANSRPTFNWSVRAAKDLVGPPYCFQMHRYHDFSHPPFMYDVEGLTSPEFTPGSPLQPDSVYYWRFLSSTDGGLSYADTSRTFAAYIVSCCSGRVGDANGEGEYPDEVTLGDIMLMVDVKFISGDCSKLPCISEADVNQDGGADPTCEEHVTLGDIMMLVDYLFITGPEDATLPDCL